MAGIVDLQSLFASPTDVDEHIENKILTAANIPDITLEASQINGLSEAIGNPVPVGCVIVGAFNSTPEGYLKMNGATLSRTTYAALFAVIGTLYGSGDGSTTFQIPDMRGMFMRGADDGRGVDSGRVFGSYQADAYQSHTHSVNPPSTSTSSDSHSHYVAGEDTDNNYDYGTNIYSMRTATGAVANRVNTSSDSHNHTVNIGSFTSGSSGSGSETRPRNLAMHFCIKY